MKKYFFSKILLAFTLIFLTSNGAFAHQPRIAVNSSIYVTNPEVSKAYYGKLDGQEAVYKIQSDKPFALYVNVLIPDIAGQKKDVSAVIIKEGTTLPIVKLDGSTFTWKKFFEEFGHDTYWMGPEYKAQVESGNYEIRVSSSNNDSKYSLAIGEIETFDIKESLNAYSLIPQIKRDFFNESPITFLLSPLGWGLILIMFVLAFIFGFIYRSILKKVARNTTRGASKNIGKKDKLVRIVIGVVLLLLAITTTWSPWLLFFSGFAFFEAIFSWCGFHAALDRNTCPTN